MRKVRYLTQYVNKFSIHLYELYYKKKPERKLLYIRLLQALAYCFESISLFGQ